MAIQQKVDPLFVIFEQHLMSFEDADSDRKTFINNVVNDYLTTLRKMNIAVPKSLEFAVVEELAGIVNAMLIKRIYGCLTVTEYREKAPRVTKKRAKSRYSKLKSRATKVVA